MSNQMEPLWPVPPKRGKHRLSDINAGERTARCSSCGPVGITSRYNWWFCRVWLADRRREIQAHEKTRAQNLWNRYGMTLEDYAAMLAIHNGACWSCGELPPPGRFLDVDHNHVTGEVRGLLCNSCNRIVGLAKDDAALLLKTAAYLETAKTRHRPTTQRKVRWNL